MILTGYALAILVNTPQIKSMSKILVHMAFVLD